MNTKQSFLINGYLKLDSLLNSSEVDSLRITYDKLLHDKTKMNHLRSDLAGASPDSDSEVERITQIMCPSTIYPELKAHIAYTKAKKWAKELLGEDMELDFDMLINKAPYTNTPTPWHQDAAYWIAMPDHRAVSCWIALDEVYEANGCMWFIPKEGENILLHKNMPNGGALYCETDTSSSQCIPLSAGGCTFHDGITLHFSKGNSTSSQRRALILNFRPESMIKYQRERAVNHTGQRKARQSNNTI